MTQTLIHGAAISDCGRYRYWLMRQWRDGGLARGRVLWVMLNPSTADALKDDHTIRRCIGYSKSWGFDGLEVVNLAAWRSTDPKALLVARSRGQDIVGPENAAHLRDAVQRCRLVVCAWGSHPVAQVYGRALVVDLSVSWGITPHALKLTADGQPAHPLRLPSNLKARLWRDGKLA